MVSNCPSFDIFSNFQGNQTDTEKQKIKKKKTYKLFYSALVLMQTKANKFQTNNI